MNRCVEHNLAAADLQGTRIAPLVIRIFNNLRLLRPGNEILRNPKAHLLSRETADEINENVVLIGLPDADHAAITGEQLARQDNPGSISGPPARDIKDRSPCDNDRGYGYRGEIGSADHSANVDADIAALGHQLGGADRDLADRAGSFEQW